MQACAVNTMARAYQVVFAMTEDIATWRRYTRPSNEA